MTSKAILESGRTLCAVSVDSGSPTVVEMVGGLGFAAVVLDARHAAVSPFSGELEALVRAAQAAGVPAIVRAPDAAPGTLNRCLNDGADGVIVPAVDGAEQAAAAAAATRYPPLGRRGAAPVVRAAGLGLTDWDDYVRDTNERRLVLASLESPEGLAAAGAIAAVDGIDGIVLDTLALGMHRGGGELVPGDEEVAAALAGLPPGAVRGVLTADADAARRWPAAGCNLVVIQGDLAAGLRQAVALRSSLSIVPTRLEVA